MKKISILVPCHNEQENIEKLYDALVESIAKINGYQWEIVFVDDGSFDDTLSRIKQLRERDERVCFISLSRNFGKENAMLAGFDHITGDAVIIMDADLQHPPHLMAEMIAEWESGYDDVYAERLNRGKESWLRRKLSMLYYRLLQRMAKVDVLPNVGDFRLLDRKCIDSLKKLRETQRYTKGLYCWIGFKKKKISFQQADREKGKSSFSYHRLFNLAIEGITSYTTAPLRISTVVGIVVSLVAFIYMCYVLIKTILYGEPVQGYPTLVILILFLGGVQLLSLGIIGEYLGRVFHETKNRPVYLISEQEGI
ncbi:MAG: glycosyltransferase family 2 protein [Paludibacteraceae bacterium]|nr:glycosyltransferase family 2 protein [Paludibacteraceae bacterium]